nr:MAG TPA: hypothetical protein [Caudoviricetes sp.]
MYTVAPKFWNLKVTHLDGVRRTRGNVESLVRGWGFSISNRRSEVSGRGQPCAKFPNQTGY